MSLNTTGSIYFYNSTNLTANYFKEAKLELIASEIKLNNGTHILIGTRNTYDYSDSTVDSDIILTADKITIYDSTVTVDSQQTSDYCGYTRKGYSDLVIDTADLDIVNSTILSQAFPSPYGLCKRLMVSNRSLLFKNRINNRSIIGKDPITDQ